MNEDHVRNHDGGVFISMVVDPSTFESIAMFRSTGGYRWSRILDIGDKHYSDKYRWDSIREELWNICSSKKK